MTIELFLHGVKMTVSKDQLFELAANGAISSDTPINVSGKLVSAKQVKGLVFGEQKEVVPNVSATSHPPTTSHSTPISRLSKERCYNVGVSLMAFSVLFGFIIGFISAAFDLWFLFWIFGPLEGTGFFVGFVMYVFSLTLTDEKQTSTVKNDQRPQISSGDHYRQALSHFQNKQNQ